jgi:mRNA interferase MazF
MPNMTVYDFGDVVLVNFFFTDQRQSAKRPAVVVSMAAYNKSHPDVLLMPITSQSHQSDQFGAVPVPDFRKAGLLKKSFIKLVIGTYRHGDILRQLGQLDPGTCVALRQALAGVLGFEPPASSPS